jgi:chromosome segregation ATPase
VSNEDRLSDLERRMGSAEGRLDKVEAKQEKLESQVQTGFRELREEIGAVRKTTQDTADEMIAVKFGLGKLETSGIEGKREILNAIAELRVSQTESWHSHMQAHEGERTHRKSLDSINTERDDFLARQQAELELKVKETDAKADLAKEQAATALSFWKKIYRHKGKLTAAFAAGGVLWEAARNTWPVLSKLLGVP